MTLRIGDNLSLLPPLDNTRQDADAVRTDNGVSGQFAQKLDGILDAPGHPQQVAAASLAEALNLQMLRTTLILSGDEPAGEQPLQQIFSGPGQTLQTLIKTYLPEGAATGTLSETATAVPAPSASGALPPEHTASAPLVVPGGTGEKWLDPILEKASRHYGVEIGLIKAVIKAESNFNPTAVSHAGARGLMQLMPATARSLGVSDSFDPEQNVMAGTRFLRDLLKRYNGDLDSALAAYNWGPGNVDRRPERLPRETREYLARVKQLYTSYAA